MATYEQHTDSAGDVGVTVFGVNWFGQTFLTTSAHPVTSVKLYIKKFGTLPAGNVTVSIRETSEGLPTGGDLTSGSLDSSVFTTSYTWYEFTVTSYNLSNSTAYAIILRFPNGVKALNTIVLSYTSLDLYTDGIMCSSSDSGSTWAEYGTERDANFQILGVSAFIPKVFII